MSWPQADNWDQHWEEFGPSVLSGPAHEYRRRIILRLLNLAAGERNIRMLEIGSGTGEFAELFQRRYPHAQFLGLELSHIGVEIAARRVPGARFLQRDLLAPAPRNSMPPYRANFAVCSEVLEHVDDPVRLLRNAAEYMAPGCKLVVTVPGGPRSAFDLHIGHRRHYRPADLKDVLERAGFQVEAAHGAGFPFFNLYRLTIISRGSRLREDIAGSPSLAVRAGMGLFGLLFHFTIMRGGWQTVAVARYRGGSELAGRNTQTEVGDDTCTGR